ncbi:MAG TPA: MBL fold metallo-hydrolase [Gammaproteobacteria bacterium]|nr:MBL fold metallo-hydrolase [Gammaproteobacteria bacterium]
MQAEITPFRHEDTGTFSYLVRDPATGSGAVIDPVLDYDPAAARTGTASAEAIVAAAREQGISLEWILETHAHADHVSGAPYVRDALGGRIGIGTGIRTVQTRFREIFNLGSGFPADGSQFDHLFEDQETFRIGDLEGRVIPTPGHTSDSVTYWIDGALFVGDSLFMPDSGTARCDFPGGDARVLYASSRRLFRFPDDTPMYMCHDYAPGGREPRCRTTVGEQRRHNIHVREEVPEEEFVRMRTERDATLGMPRLILPSVQINIRAGALPPPESNGTRYLRIPLNVF